jgi:hypothetical protein
MNIAADNDVTDEKLMTHLFTDFMNNIGVGHCN